MNKLNKIKKHLFIWYVYAHFYYTVIKFAIKYRIKNRKKNKGGE